MAIPTPRFTTHTFLIGNANTFLARLFTRQKGLYRHCVPQSLITSGDRICHNTLHLLLSPSCLFPERRASEEIPAIWQSLFASSPQIGAIRCIRVEINSGALVNGFSRKAFIEDDLKHLSCEIVDTSGITRAKLYNRKKLTMGFLHCKKTVILQHSVMVKVLLSPCAVKLYTVKPR